MPSPEKGLTDRPRVGMCSGCDRSHRGKIMTQQLRIVLGVALFVSGGWVSAQGHPVTLPTRTPGMPGQVVGSSSTAAGVGPVGTRLPASAPMAGSAVGTGAGGIPSPLDPRMPQPAGRPLNTANVVAPYPMMPNAEPGFWDSLYNRWAMLFGSSEPAKRPTNFTPGISRRNRERDNMWRRD